MPPQKQPEKVEPISGSEETKLRTEGLDYSEELKKTQFDEALEKAKVAKVEKQTPAQAPPSIEIAQNQPAKESLMDLAKKTSQEVPKVAVTPSDLSTQASQLRQRMRTTQNLVTQAQSQNVQLPAADLKKMSAHIEHIDQGLKDITKLTKGVEVGSAVVSKEKPPLTRFLSYLTESDKKLNTFMDEIGGLKIGKQQLSPDVLLGIQIKLGFVSQELEFFTSTLNKALESTKTVMNVQI